MKDSFIEVYDNALPDDVCNSLVSLFDRENEIEGSVVEAGTNWGRRKDLYSALELKLADKNYFYRDIISDLDYIINQKIFEYNKILYSVIINMINFICFKKFFVYFYYKFIFKNFV